MKTMHNAIFGLCISVPVPLAIVSLVDPVTDDALCPSSFKITEPGQFTQKSSLALNPIHLSGSS